MFCLCALAALLCVGAFFLRGKRRVHLGVLFAAAGMLLGFAVWGANLAFNYTPAARYHGKSGVLTCTVSEYPAVYEKYTSVTVHTQTFAGERMKRTKVLLYLDGDYGSLAPGDVLTVRASFAIPESRWNFDKFRYYRSRRIYLTADAGEVLEQKEVGFDLRYLPVKWTRACTERLNALMPPQNAAILSALLFGDESALPDEYVSDLRKTGLSHITAVSGMNVSFLVGLLLLVFRRKVGSYIAVPTVILFILMTGGSASVTRAGIMQLIWLAAYFINREADSVNSLFLACGIILLANPFAVADVGLWLSFSATLGLVLIGRPMQRFVMDHMKLKARVPRRILEGLTGAVCTTLAAQAFVIPIQVLAFGDISLISPLSNLLVVPLSEYSFTGGVIALLLSFVWLPLGRFAALLPVMLTDYQLAVVPALARLPLATVSTDSVYVAAFLIFSYVFALLWIWKRPRRRAVMVCCIAAALGMAVLCGAMDGLLLSRISIVDTVSGQSVVVCDRDANVVVNCGGGYASACTSVTDALHRSNARAVALFLLTDYRAASAGNAETLLETVRVETLLLPEPATEKDAARRDEITAAAGARGTDVVYAADGASFAFGGVRVRVYENLEPGGDKGRLMAYLEVSGYRVLCLGSVYPENIGYLLANAEVSGIDAVAAGDYYAGRMVPPAVLRYEPGLCVFSSYAGADRDVLARVSAAGAAIVETERMGGVYIRQPRLYGMAK